MKEMPWSRSSMGLLIQTTVCIARSWIAFGGIIFRSVRSNSLSISLRTSYAKTCEWLCFQHVVLCIGGACKYVCQKGVHVTDEWIWMHIVLNILNHFDSQIALVLGRAVIWAAFNPETSGYVPANILWQINTFYTYYILGSLSGWLRRIR
jgi:hypothetical protein